jgi:hypothetical protein
MVCVLTETALRDSQKIRISTGHVKGWWSENMVVATCTYMLKSPWMPYESRNGVVTRSVSPRKTKKLSILAQYDVEFITTLTFSVGNRHKR